MFWKIHIHAYNVIWIALSNRCSENQSTTCADVSLSVNWGEYSELVQIRTVTFMRTSWHVATLLALCSGNPPGVGHPPATDQYNILLWTGLSQNPHISTFQSISIFLCSQKWRLSQSCVHAEFPPLNIWFNMHNGIVTQKTCVKDFNSANWWQHCHIVPESCGASIIIANSR